MGLEIQYGGQNVRAASSYLNLAYSWHLDQKIELIGGTKYLRIDAEKNISILKILPFTIFTLLYPQLEKLFIKERFWNVHLLSVLKSKYMHEV